MRIHLKLLALVVFCLCSLTAAEHKGQVKFGGLPVPGATVTATQGDRTLVAIADKDGNYSFADLPDGVWNFQVEMLGFAPIKQEVTISAGEGAPEWDLKMLSFDEIKASAAPPPPPARISVSQPQPETPQTTAAASQNAVAQNTAPQSTSQKSSKNKKAAAAAAPANSQNSFQRTAVNANPNAAPAPAPTQSAAAEAVPSNSPFANQSASDLSQRASDGLLINGTVNNGASSPFAQAASFGNNRRGPGSLYNGGIGVIEDNSVVDANAFSYTGQPTPKPGYNHFTGVANFGGPIRIPHLIQNGPFFFVGYQWIRSSNSTGNATNTYTVPTAAQREGDFSSLAAPIYNPGTGAPFPGNLIPPSLISPQAQALLKFYPMPNLPGSLYNFQIPLLTETHTQSLNTRLQKNIGNKNSLNGFFVLQRTATDTPNEFAFIDKANTQGIVGQANWQHRISQRMFIHFQYQFSRNSTATTPNFANRENVSGQDGILGNNQQPVNWGPPSLTFSSGIAPLTDANAAANHNQTNAFTVDSQWIRGRHTISYGADFKRLEFNYLSQQNPRGAFTFDGAYTAAPATGSGVPTLGSDFADFLLGVPDISQIAFGNADKYFRQSLWDGFVNDDWRIGPSLTVNYGGRWEYSAPITELYGRLVNLDIAPGFSAIAPVVASNPVGPLTGIKYPDSLIQPDKRGFEPKIGIAWRPIPASSLVVRAGYGVYYNTSVYQTIAQQMAQQSPLSTSLSVQNTPANPLTLANGFTAPVGAVPNTFAIDPNFKVGYAQTWQVSAQRDLPGSLVMTATYLGIKGTRGPQEFLPNTYPEGSTVNQCPPTCPALPSGFIYMTSNGNSTRESGSLQLRRRLHNGFLASATYTYSKSIDDSALGGKGQGANVIAQNWLDLSAERGLSNFDQRHTLALQAQYTSGQGIGGGTLLSGWRGALLKEWITGTTINAGTGLPLTPTVLAAQTGTGVSGTLRPDYTGAPLYAAPPGYDLNPAAYALAPLGEFGNAGRNTITGPVQFTLNGSVGRTFRLHDRYSLDLRVDATNALNHVTFASFNTIVNSGQFGLPTPPANNMRDLITTLRLRF
jgi:trimeric autotransporter adhesin